MPHKKTHMKTNQDGGSITAKDPGLAAKELKKNENEAAKGPGKKPMHMKVSTGIQGPGKMGYQQEFGAARMSPSKRGDAKASELMHGAAKYYDGAGQYMNGAPKYEGAGKYNGPMDAGHGEEPGHTHPDNIVVTASRTSPISNENTLSQEQQEYDKNTENVVRSLAAKDSINLVNQGKQFRANLLYGKNYDYNKKLPGTKPSEGRVTQYTAKERQKQFEKLKREALKIQGPRPTQENRSFEL